MALRLILAVVCLGASALVGCAGEDDFRAVALQSAGIASRAGQAAKSFTAAQNRMNAANERTLTSIEQRTTAIEADITAREVGWSDSWAKGMVGEASALETDDLAAIAAAIYAPPPAPKPQITFDDAAMEKLLILLTDLGQEPDFEDRAVFLGRFAAETKDEFEAALENANKAANASASPASTLPTE